MSAAIDATWRDRWYREHPEDRRVYLPNAHALAEERSDDSQQRVVGL